MSRIQFLVILIVPWTMVTPETVKKSACNKNGCALDFGSYIAEQDTMRRYRKLGSCRPELVAKAKNCSIESMVGYQLDYFHTTTDYLCRSNMTMHGNCDVGFYTVVESHFCDDKGGKFKKMVRSYKMFENKGACFMVDTIMDNTGTVYNVMVQLLILNWDKANDVMTVVTCSNSGTNEYDAVHILVKHEAFCGRTENHPSCVRCNMEKEYVNIHSYGLRMKDLKNPNIIC